MSVNVKKHFLNYVIQKSYFLIFVIMLLAALIPCVLAEISVGFVNISNTTCLNFSAAPVNQTANCEIFFHSGGSPNPNFFNTSQGVYVMGIGAMMNISSIVSVPLYGVGGYTGSFPYYQEQDGIAFYISSSNTYGIIVLDQSKNPLGGANINPLAVNVSYKYNNQSGNASMGGVDSSPCASMNQQQCIGDLQFNCWWDFGTNLCKQDMMGGNKMNGPFADCFMFSTNISKCGMINVCVNDSMSCQNNATIFDFAKGIQCANITNGALCNNIKMLMPLCSWNSERCEANYSKQSSQPPVFMCNEALGNETLCYQLISDWNMPCSFNASGTSLCEMNSSMMCNGPSCGFKDMKTESNCQAIGGTWRSETYTYSDSYGQTKTQTDTWCEMGFSKETCSNACYACEKDVSLANGNNSGQAKEHCENSALGFCTFHNDSHAMNGLGWCDMKQEMFFGAGKCDVNCFDCNFMNNPSLECNNSQAGCKWFVDPADPTNKWCDSAKVRDCSTDCFTCYDNNSCSMSIAKPDKNTQGGCSWDAAQSICKFKYAPTKEICFNGLDDDSDNNIDCKDTDCMYDSFCGGDNLISGTQFVDCWTFGSSQTFCEQNNASCIFLDFDGEGGMPGFCERRGEHCFFAYSDHFSITGINETRCSGDASCKVNAAGKCEINNTMAMICNNNLDAANCSTGARAGICQWYNNSFGPGYCDFIIFDCNNNQSRMTGQSACEASGFCIWHQDPFGNSGFCSPLCMNNSANTQELCEGLDDSVLAGACKYNTKSCEPKALMGSDCPSKNQGNCTESNQTCMWISGANQCVDKLMMEQFAGMEGGNPAMLGTDTVSGSGYTDIVGLGVKDSQKSLVFGLQLSSVSQSSICDATKNNASYFLYLDTNGKPNDNCNASTDSEIQAGFEFYFKMQGQGSAIIQVSYKCMNGEWVPAPITFKYKNDVMCNDIRGPMFGIDKQDLQKNLKLYNATVNLRVIGASANSSDNITHPTDSIGPFYYTPGAADFKMEDCNAPGQDLDGDGFDSENDPDCQKFKKNGYIPMEVGPQCADGIDNDGNGLTDCQDDSCKFDPFVCSGQYNASADKTAPSVIWHKSNVFTSRFFVDFDTNEPSNGTLLFYNNETCNGTANINRTYQFLPPDATGNDIYFPWHHIEVENLNQNITYYYKVKVVDPAGNPATSACMNVTTATAITNITVGFDFMPPLDYYNSECLGTLYFSFDWGSDGVWDVINSTMAYAIKVNETQGKNSTIKFTSPNATQFWSISLIGVDISEAISSALSNLSTIFYTNCTLTDPFIGMNSDKFNGILQSLRPKYILLTIPDNGNTLQHCDENNLSSCSDVTGNVTKTDSSTDSSTWKVPVKTGLGFSVYTVVASGMNYTLNFSNISSTNLQLDTITNNSILINVSDTNNENMTYNFSLRVSGSALNYTINGSYPTLDMVNFSTQKNFSLNITFWSTTPGVRNVSLIATLYNDSTVVLNSSDDISYITVNITDATNPGVAITTPSSGWYASNFIVNATVTDNGALSTVQYRWENSSQNGSWVSMSNPTGNFWNATFDITSVSGGNYTLRINATDVSGNKNYSVTVTKIAVDDTIPALTNPSPAHNGFVASLTAQVFSVTATETGIILNATVFHRRSGTSVWNSNTLTCYGASPYICNVSVDISAKYLDNFTLDVYYEVYDNALNKGNNGTSGSPLTYTVDVSTPKYTYNGTNATVSTKTGENVLFNATLTDGKQLDAYIFSTNDSNYWVNSSAVDISGTSYPANATEVINSARGKYVCGKFFFNDTAGNINNTDNVCFTVANTAPVISPAISAQTRNSDESWSYDANATDADNETLTWYINDSKLSINSSTGVINDTPSEAESGVYTVLVSVDDGYVNTTGSFTYTIVDNVAPKFSYNGTNATANTKTSESVLFNATITDGNELGYYIFSTNDSGSWVNNTAIGISGTTYPANATEVINATRGMYVCGKFFFNDTAGNINSTSNVCFTVNNTAPVISPAISNQTKNSDESWSYDANATDADNDTLAWYINDNKLSINSTTGVINDTPSEDESGTYTVLVSVDDGYVNTTDTFTYTIFDTLYPQYSYNGSNATANTKTGESVLFNATITDGKQLDYYIFSTNDSGSWVNSSAVDISGTSYPANATEIINSVRSAYICGKFFFNDTSSNLNSTDNACFTVANGAPTQNQPTISPETAYTNSTLTCNNVSTSDADGDTVTNYYRWFKNGTLLSTETSSTLSSSNFNKTSAILCEITPDDGYNNGTAQNTSIKLFANLAPYINVTIDTQTVNSGINWIFDVNATDPDVLDGVDTLSWWVNDSKISIDANGIMADTPLESEAGTYTINVTVGDGSVNDTQSFTYIINDATKPSITINTPASGWYNTNFIVNSTVTDNGVLSTVRYRWENTSHNGSWTSMSNPGGNWNATFDITSVSDGNYTIRVNATDASGNQNTTVTVINIGIDDSSPTLLGPSPPNNGYINSLTAQVFSINVTETTSGIKNATVFHRIQAPLAWSSNTLTCYGSSPYTCNATVDLSASYIDGDSLEIYYEIYDNALNKGNNGTAGSPLANTIDASGPTFSYNGSNASSATKTGESVLFNATITDGNELDYYIFSTNDSGSWVNSTAIGISGTTYPANATEVINATRGMYVCGKFFFNDTAGNINSTSNVCFTVNNTAPVISPAISNQTKNSDESWSYDANATDADSDTLTWYINDSKLSINSSTGVISDTPSEDESGVYTILVSVDDSSINTTDSFTYTIVDNVAPKFSYNGTNATANTKTSETVLFNATITDGKQLDYYIFSTNDSGNWVNSSAVDISGTTYPANATEVINATRGMYVCGKFFFNDTAGNINNTYNVCFTVANTEPVISPAISAQSKNSGESWSYDVNASDADSDTLTWYINDSKLSINSGTGVISDTPSEDESGVYTILVSVDDGYVNTTGTFTYTIVDNVAPQFSYNGSNATASTKTGESVLFNATLTDGKQLDYYIFSTNDSGSWINSTAVDISGTSYLANATEVINSVRSAYVCGKFFFNDTSDNINSTDNVCFTVANTAPVISPVIVDQTRNSGDSWSYDVNASDADSETLTWYINDSKLSINSGTGVISDTPSEDESGVYTILVSVDDGYVNTTGTFTYTIVDNVAPQFNYNGSNAAASTKTGESVLFNATITDVKQLDYYIFSTNDSGSWVNSSAVDISGTSYTATATEVIDSTRGKYVCGKFFFNDTAGNINSTDNACFTVANTAPVISPAILDQSRNSDESWSYDANASDTDSETLTWYINDSKLSINSSTGVITDTPSEAESGVYTVLVSVDDGLVNTTDSFTYTIVDNVAPKFNYNGTNATVNTKTSETVLFNATITDVKQLDYYIFSTNDSGSWVNSTAVDISGTSYPANATEVINSVRGRYVCGKFFFNDTAGNINSTDNACFTVANTAPVISPAILDQSRNSDESWSYDANASDSDSDTLTWYINDSKLSINSSTGVISDTPSEAESGVYTVLVSVDDGTINTTDTFTYTIVDNVAPKFSYNGTNATVNTKTSETVLFNATITDVGQLDYYIFSTNDSNSWVNSTPVDISGTTYPANATEVIDSTRGKYVCGKFFFNDTAGNLNSTDNVCFTVANTEPVISPAIADQSRNVDESWSYDANASDADSDTLTWYINDSKLGIDTSTGNISDTPSESESGVYTILVSVDDGSINTTDTFTYTIVDNVAPQFSYNGSNATTSTKTSESVLFNATITDGKQLNYYIFSTNDSGNWVNSSAVDISGTSYTATATEIINSTRGKYVCGKFFFNDSAGNINSTDSVCFTIANTAPFISPSISAQTRNVAETWSYDANATDADNDTLTWYINDSKLSIDTSTGNISDIPIETESGVYTVLASVDDGYINTTGTFTYTIVDNVAPQFSYNGSNATASTKTSESILFNASITDGKQLDYYIFSTNDSSSWVNSSAIDISGTSYTASASEVIDSTRGKYVCGKFFFNDTAGNINSTDNACFTVANTAPVISPAILDQSRNSDESWSYDANASDSDSDTLTWYINDSRLSINSTTGVITDTPLESEAGTYTVLVTVGDGYDNTTLTFAYTVNDVTKPSVTITTPSSGWYTTNFVVNATVTDSGSGVSTVQYRLENSSENGSWVSMSNLSGNFWNATFDITSIADGNYTIRINATDASSNSNTSVTVTNIGIDDIKPSVVSQTTVYPTGQTYARQGDSVTLNVTVTDETSSIKNVTASAGSTCSANITLTKQGSTNYWSGTCTIATNASDGTQSLVITAYDNAGNFNNTINVLVNADLTSPSSPSNVQFVADPTTSYDDDTTLNVTWSAATDGTSGVKEYKVYISANGGAYTLDGTTSNLYYSFTGADGSNYSVNVTAVDNANNENYTGSVSTTTIIVDTTLPTKPTLTSPSNNTYSNDTTPLLNWSAATESYFENYTIQVSDSSSFTAINYTYKNTVSVNNNTYQVTSAWTQDTAWYWKVKVYDAARNSNTSEYFIYHLDNTPPSSVARYAGPTNGSAQQSSSTQNIQIMVNDTNKTSATITLNYWREAKDDTNSDGDWDSAEQQTITMTNITPQGLSTIYSANIDDKSNSWQGSTVLYWATGIDAAGNSISSTTGGSGSSPLVSYTIDDTPPFVSDSSPSDTVNTSSISLNVTTNENGYCKFDTESKAFSSMTYTMGGSGTAHNYTLSGLSHGITYAFYVRCNDTLGNVMTSSEVITFTVSLGPDATPPIITNTYPNGTISSSSTSLNATTNENSYCKFDAADKSFDSMSYTMTGSETTHNYTVSSLSNGNYQYYIRCNDSSNNNMTTSAIIAFTVNLGLDTTAPVVIASGPNGTDSDGNVTLYATTDEASTCRYSTTDQAYVTMEGTDISGAVTTNHSVNKTSLGNGDYQYYIRCNDSSGNIMTSSSVISFTVNLGLDTTPPVVVNSDPSSTVTNVTPDLSVTTDENAICKYDTTDKSFDNMANTMTGVTTTHTADLGTLSDIINYQYYVRCNDSSNNKMTSSAVIEFYINTGADTTPPIVTATYPNGTISASSMSLNATTNENSYCKFDVADKSFDSMVYTLEGSGTAHNYSLSSLTDGDYQYYIRCNDTNNNNMTTSAIIAFTVSDITAPNAPTSLTAVQVGVTRQVNLSWTASTSSDTQGYNIYRALGPVSKSSALIATVGKVTKYADSVPTNGNWNYTITAFDEVPNEGTEATEANVTVTIDNTLPTITINNGTYGPYRSDPGNVIDVDFSDDSGLDYVQYKIGSDGIWTTILSGINETSFTTNWGLLWGNLREGVNILYLRAYDDAGNARVAEETVKFTVDTTNPTVVITNPTTGISSGISTTLTVITSEAATCTWKTTGNYATMSTTGTIVHEQSLTNLANGSNTVYVNCSDTAGNYPSVKTVSWTVDTAGPQMSALIFGDSDAVVNTSFSVDAVVTGGLYTLSGAQYVFNSVSNAATTITLPKDGAWDETSEEINFTALDISSLSDGAHTLYIRANNSEGTWGGWEAKGFQIDTAKPTINITSPTNGSTASTTTPTITFTVTDEVDGSNINLSSITVTDSLNGNIGFSAAACTTGDNGRIYTCSFTSSALTDTSNHTITINANDKAGNSAATSTATFEVDTTKTITASLIVTDTIGVSNNNYSDGWSFTFNISTGTGGNALRFKMSNWVLSTDATKTIAIAGNVIMNYTNASGILKTYNVLNTYNESASIHSLYDQDSSVSGTQTNITIYVKIPVGTTSGTYTTAYSAGLYNV